MFLSTSLYYYHFGTSCCCRCCCSYHSPNLFSTLPSLTSTVLIFSLSKASDRPQRSFRSRIFPCFFRIGVADELRTSCGRVRDAWAKLNSRQQALFRFSEVDELNSRQQALFRSSEELDAKNRMLASPCAVGAHHRRHNLSQLVEETL